MLPGGRGTWIQWSLRFSACGQMVSSQSALLASSTTASTEHVSFLTLQTSPGRVAQDRASPGGGERGRQGQKDTQHPPDSPAHVHLQGRQGAGRHNPGRHTEHHGVSEDGGFGEILQGKTSGKRNWPQGPEPGWFEDHRGPEQAACSLVSREAPAGWSGSFTPASGKERPSTKKHSSSPWKRGTWCDTLFWPSTCL